MWTKPWTFKEGFAIGVGLSALGILLQTLVGPISWSLVAWPVNIILLIIYMVLLVVAYWLSGKVHFFRWGMSYYAAVPALVFVSLFAVVLGLMSDLSLLSSWPFVVVYSWMTSIVGMVCIKRIVHFRQWQRDVPFLLNHLGLFIALVTATLGHADFQRLQMTVGTGQMEWRAIDEQSQVHELPFAIELRKFTIEEYPPQQVVQKETGRRVLEEHIPKQYVSEVTVCTPDGIRQDATIKVNHPLDAEGWKVYQFSYGNTDGQHSDISIFEVVRDPWLSVVYTGIFMLILGAVCYAFFLPFAGIVAGTRWHRKWVLSFFLLLVLLSIGIFLFEQVRQGKTIMPALQSPWFAPHVVIYMFCYTMMGVATWMALPVLFRRRKNLKQGGVPVKQHIFSLTDNLVCVGLSLMTIGMLFGALWAKEAWGHYWAWDPKETWAAATWFLFLTYLHFRLVRPHHHKLASLILVLSFCCLQMCWWGINYLPSAQGRSVHTYNVK